MILTFACLIPGTPAAAKGAAVGLFTYIASFGATWLPLPWLYPAEINPIKTRAKANAVSTCTNWLFNFAVVMIVPTLIDNIPWGTYLLFACINACFFPILYFFYPEVSFPGNARDNCWTLANKQLDCKPIAGRNRYHLRQGLRREHLLRQSSQGTAVPHPGRGRTRGTQVRALRDRQPWHCRHRPREERRQW